MDECERAEAHARNHAPLSIGSGFRVYEAALPPRMVLVHVPAADEHGVHIPGLDRGVIPIVPARKSFQVHSARKKRRVRKVTIRHTQLGAQPLKVRYTNALQGSSHERMVMHLGQPPDNRLDNNAIYTSLTRTTSKAGVALLTPLSLEQLNVPRDADEVADDARMEALARHTEMRFREGRMPSALPRT